MDVQKYFFEFSSFCYIHCVIYVEIMDKIDPVWVRGLVEGQGMTIRELSDLLKAMYPGSRGFGKSNVHDFMVKHNIQPKKLSNAELEHYVIQARNTYGPGLGSKLMRGKCRVFNSCK